MKLKKSYKALIAVCAVVLVAVAATDASLVNSIATVGGGIMQKFVYTIATVGGGIMEKVIYTIPVIF